MTQIDKSTLLFLKDLSRHNQREWFTEHKARYTRAHENMILFAEALLTEMRRHDHIETPTGKAALMRIYNDIRFAKDKAPYKTYFGGGFRRATKRLRGGYYFQIGPGQSLAAGGFFGPNPEDTLRIRKDMETNYPDWQKLLKQKKFHETFGPMQGDQVSTAPRGFDKNHPAIALIRHKQFYFEHTFSDQEVLKPDFAKLLSQTFKTLRPWFDYMSEVLTTDLNGVSIL